jgi:dihydrofolate synthase/folylpolyglutamate synthase
LPLFPKKAIYYFCKPNIPRGLATTILQEESRKHQLLGDTHPSVADAYNEAKKKATKNDFIFIGGSTFVVAELPLNKGLF